MVAQAGTRGGRSVRQMINRVAATDLPESEERVCDAAPAGDERSGQGRRDSRAAVPDHDAATATRPGEDAIRSADRAFLAALLPQLPPKVLRKLGLLVRPDMVLRWHHDLLARRHAVQSRPQAPRPASDRVRSEAWSCVWQRRILTGGIAGSMVNC